MSSGQKVIISPIESGQTFPMARTGALMAVAMYVIGILVGLLFVALWLAGAAEWGLGLAGVGAILLCAYLLPESLGPAFIGDSLILGNDRFQYIRGGKHVLGNVTFANVDEIILNQMDGGNSLWVRLKDPEVDGVLWIGGPHSMNVIHSQCGYHLVVGKRLLTDAKTLEAEFQKRIA